MLNQNLNTLFIAILCIGVSFSAQIFFLAQLPGATQSSSKSLLIEPVHNFGIDLNLFENSMFSGGTGEKLLSRYKKTQFFMFQFNTHGDIQFFFDEILLKLQKNLQKLSNHGCHPKVVLTITLQPQSSQLDKEKHKTISDAFLLKNIFTLSRYHDVFIDFCVDYISITTQAHTTEHTYNSKNNVSPHHNKIYLVEDLLFIYCWIPTKSNYQSHYQFEKKELTETRRKILINDMFIGTWCKVINEINNLISLCFNENYCVTIRTYLKNGIRKSRNSHNFSGFKSILLLEQTTNLFQTYNISQNELKNDKSRILSFGISTIKMDIFFFPLYLNINKQHQIKENKLKQIFVKDIESYSINHKKKNTGTQIYIPPSSINEVLKIHSGESKFYSLSQIPQGVYEKKIFFISVKMKNAIETKNIFLSQNYTCFKDRKLFQALKILFELNKVSARSNFFHSILSFVFYSFEYYHYCIDDFDCITTQIKF